MNNQQEEQKTEFEFTGNMPDVMAKDSIAAYQIGAYTVLLSKDLPSIAEGVTGVEIPEMFRMHYKYVLTVAGSEGYGPKLFVTLESFGQGPYMLGVLHSGGSHDNHGTMIDPDNINEFIVRGFDLIKESLHIQGDPTRIGNSEDAKLINKAAIIGGSNSFTSHNSLISSPLVKYTGYYIFIIAAACLCAFLFYWYDYRPAQIRISCEAEASALAAETMKGRARMEPWRYKDDADNGFILVADKEVHYKNCLRKNGLEPSDEKAR